MTKIGDLRPLSVFPLTAVDVLIYSAKQRSGEVWKQLSFSIILIILHNPPSHRSSTGCVSWHQEQEISPSSLNLLIPNPWTGATNQTMWTHSICIFHGPNHPSHAHTEESIIHLLALTASTHSKSQTSALSGYNSSFFGHAALCVGSQFPNQARCSGSAGS